MERITGKIKLVGESTLGQLYELLLTHMNHSAFAWPYHIDIEMSRDRYSWTDKIRGQGIHSEFHGLSVVLAHAREELLQFPPEVIVQLQVANDAARDTLEMYRKRMAEWCACACAARHSPLCARTPLAPRVVPAFRLADVSESAPLVARRLCAGSRC